MKIAIYGGSFNPPHLGHLEAATAVCEELKPDKLLIIPDNIPPHKDMDADSPSPEARLELCRLNFAGLPNVEISDMELRRQGKSYTAQTIEQLRAEYPADELLLVVGSDMFLSFEEWYEFEYLLKNCALVIVSREEDDMEKLRAHKAYMEREYSARVNILSRAPLPMSSSEIRVWLRRRMGADTLKPEVYSAIIRNNYYDARPEIMWLREEAEKHLAPKRIAHVAGCESEAVLLAMQYGEDPETAAEAAILHDITKKLDLKEQLNLCEKYGIILDKDQQSNESLLHAITGAALARDLYGVSDEVYEAIRWHTTGKPDMTLLEKIIYMADYVEPTRDFPGVEKLRALARKDLDRAMTLGLEMSLEDLKSRGIEIDGNTAEAYSWYSQQQ